MLPQEESELIEFKESQVSFTVIFWGSEDKILENNAIDNSQS